MSEIHASVEQILREANALISSAFGSSSLRALSDLFEEEMVKKRKDLANTFTKPHQIALQVARVVPDLLSSFSNQVPQAIGSLSSWIQSTFGTPDLMAPFRDKMGDLNFSLLKDAITKHGATAKSATEAAHNILSGYDKSEQTLLNCDVDLAKTRGDRTVRVIQENDSHETERRRAERERKDAVERTKAGMAAGR